MLAWRRFWPEGRVRLWEEKLQLRSPFKGNAATQWGTVQEDVALRCYSEVSTIHADRAQASARAMNLVEAFSIMRQHMRRLLSIRLLLVSTHALQCW